MAHPKVIARVRAGGELGLSQANQINNRLYFIYSENNAVGVFDTKKNRILTRIRVGTLPFDLVVNPQTNRIYVTNFHDGTISVINGSTNRVIKTIKVGRYPDSIGIHLGMNRIYVPVSSGNLTIIDGTTNKILKRVPLGGRPSALVIDEQRHLIYVTNVAKDNVSIINGRTQAVVATVKVGKNPVIRPAFNPYTNRLYVANNLSRFLSVIDGSTHKLLRNIPLGRLQSDIAINLATNRIYVSSAQIETPGKLFVIDGSSLKILTTMVLPPSTNLFMNPKTNHLFISDFDKNTLSIYNGTSLRRVTTFNNTAGSFTLDPLTNRVYVGGNQTITVIQDAK